ncbi:RNA polymerase sigma factor [Kitasatospora purpeofusca]|uniref:RNA polymerase sigma factor n=1 Tax=Kitasatospora purpeofusca TaxID=67352 RepID=UPI003815534D
MTEKDCCAECGVPATVPFEAAYGLYYRPLVRSVRQRAAAWGLSDQDVDVEALVQDTFEQALPVWHTIRVPRAWLYTVARCRLARCVPAAALRAAGDPADHAEQRTVGWSTVAPSASTEDLVAAREVVELIQLMPQQRRREVAYLRYVEEWGFNEIAEQLGCCPATARVHALKARGDIVVRVKGDGDSYQMGRDVAAPLIHGTAGAGLGWLAVLLVLGGVLCGALALVGFLVGWPWALAAAGGIAALALAGRAWAGRRRWRRRMR